MALNWYQAGIHTRDEAREHSVRYSKGIRIKKFNIRDIRLYAQATNLLTLFSEYYNKYSGEPEIMRDVDSAQKRNLSLNVTYLTPPQARTYTIGLSVNF